MSDEQSLKTHLAFTHHSLLITVSFHSFNHVAGGHTVYERQANNAAAGRFHFLAAVDLIQPIVTTFDQNVRQQCRDQFARRIGIKNGYVVDLS